MSNEQPRAPESGARRWYGRLIDLYPGAFRERYASEMIRVFDESWSRVSNQGAIARWRYWLHVIRDFLRTFPGEWLAAMPLPTKVSVFAVGMAVSLWAIDHQWLIIVHWLFFCAFATVCWALIYSSRLHILSSLLLAGALSWAGMWITTLLAKSIHGSHDHQPNTADHLCVIMAVLVVLFCKEILTVRSLPGWDTTRKIRPPRTKVTSQFVLSALCYVGIVLAQFKIISGGGSAIAGSQAVLALFLSICCENIVSGQLAAIWRTPEKILSPA